MRPRFVSRAAWLLLASLLVAACHESEPGAGIGCHAPKSRALTPGQIETRQVEVRDENPVSGFGDVNDNFYGLPDRIPRPRATTPAHLGPFLPGVPDGRYRATFRLGPTTDSVTMTVAGRTITLDGPLFCD